MPKPQQKRIPKIKVIKNSDSNIDIKEKAIECLTTEKKIQTKSLYLNKKEELIITCINNNSVELTESVLKEKMEGLCSIKKEEFNNPKLKIVGIDNDTKMKLEAIEHDTNVRNFSDFASKGTVLHMYNNKHNNMSTVLMEVPAELNKHVKENNSKIFVGYQNCNAYDLINIRPCNNCARYGHSERKCTNEIVCLNCSEAHKTSDCVNPSKKCTNCVYSNSNYNTNFEPNHYAYDYESCSILK